MTIDRSKTAFVIPAKNEEESLGAILEDLSDSYDIPVIVVDDCSTDNTISVAKSYNATVLPHVHNMGAWRATQTGIRFALRAGYERVITLDADGQHRVDQICKLLGESDLGYDLVIGSCTSRGRFTRKIAWKAFKAITQLSVFDLTSGFRCYRKPAMEALSSRQSTMLEYQDVGVLLLLRNLNMKSKEVAVIMEHRTNGISRIFYSWFAVIKYLLYTFILSTTKAFPGGAEKVAGRLGSD